MKPDESLERLHALAPEQVARNLAYAGLYLLASELIGDHVVRRVYSFYDRVTFHGGPFTSYDHDVRSRHKDIFHASLLWLRDLMGALDSEEVMAILAVRARRNTIAHELVAEIASLAPARDDELLARARGVLFGLSNFWVKMEISADPEFQNLGIDWDTVHGADLTLLDMVIQKTREIRRTP